MKATPQQNSALDPRTLGRPVHLLGKFTALLRHDLAERLRTSLNRRYRAHFEIAEVAVARPSTSVEEEKVRQSLGFLRSKAEFRIRERWPTRT